MLVDELSYMRDFGYPEKWLEESKRYAPNDSYIITKTSWALEPIPPVPMISIYELWKRSVERCPDDTAVIFLDKKITYKEMDLIINKYSSLLLDLGVKRGDVVATMLPNCFQHWVAFYGAARIGAIHTPLNVMYKEREISYQIKDCGAGTIVTFDLYYQLYFAKLREELGIKNVIVTNLKDFASPDTNPEALKTLRPFWDAPKTKIEGTVDLFDSIEKYEPAVTEIECSPKEATALLLYTAGTTAPEPKGVIITHFNLVFNSLSHTHQLKCWKKREVNYSIMPMFHTAGYLLHGLPAFYQGGTVIPIPILDVEEAFRITQQYKANVIFGPPTFYIALMQHPRLREYDLGSLELTVRLRSARSCSRSA
jgi:long-chain acyl-CoA synthetase